ncbi:sulfatase [Natrialba asiatica]|uniref:Sulfatase n=1 Tax=Natrialba asiatica (strain ATCC 700177 / DSM 12278 / JCM 9576 / FERM P-10747 / NBRC 102637 / 172P1) TaxID=29540 RepID=M0B170_NATA1|nr:sulfatase [Natrialba asiatica]ELZ03444.1 sulfatase [Natrialba asiatica DSM 12278]
MTNSGELPPVDDLDTVILLSADSLRADRVHATRNGEPLTPTLDELAAEALEFEPGIAPGPSTRDTIPSMLTGKYPSQFDEYGLPAGGSPTTIAEELSDRGFATAGLSQNNFTGRRYNIDRGFDYFDDVSAEARKENDGGAWRLYVRNLIEDTPLMDAASHANNLAMEHLGKSLFHRDDGADVITDRALDWMAETDGKRFLWVHYMDTHHPYLSPKRIQKQYGRVFSPKKIKQLSQKTRSAQDEITDADVPDMEYVYDCSVRYVDEQIGRLFDHLRSEGEFENSLIIVTGDHGEGFGEFGKFGHAHELWDTLVAVPLIVRHPHGPTRTVDGQAPLRLLKESIVDGSGLFELSDGGADSVYTEVPDYREDIKGVRGTEYKLIDTGDERIATRIDDGDGDGDEEVIPVSEIPESKRERLAAELDREFEPVQVASDVERREFKKDLAALGYLDE